MVDATDGCYYIMMRKSDNSRFTLVVFGRFDQCNALGSKSPFESGRSHKPLEECEAIAYKPLRFTGCPFKCTADTTERRRRAVEVLL